MYYLWTPQFPGKSTTIFVHILMASVAGHRVPTTHSGDSLECSHACESFNYLLVGSGVHKRCCNPRHIFVETHNTNVQRRTCVSVREDGCSCGAQPPCIDLRPAWDQQLAAYEELWACFPAQKPTYPMPSLSTFTVQTSPLACLETL